MVNVLGRGREDDQTRSHLRERKGRRRGCFPRRTSNQNLISPKVPSVASPGLLSLLSHSVLSSTETSGSGGQGPVPPVSRRPLCSDDGVPFPEGPPRQTPTGPLRTSRSTDGKDRNKKEARCQGSGSWVRNRSRQEVGPDPDRKLFGVPPGPTETTGSRSRRTAPGNVPSPYGDVRLLGSSGMRKGSSVPFRGSLHRHQKEKGPHQREVGTGWIRLG